MTFAPQMFISLSNEHGILVSFLYSRTRPLIHRVLPTVALAAVIPHARSAAHL